MIDKTKIVDELLTKAKEDLAQAKAAFSTTKEHTCSAELKSEGKYDTRSIESGYLAGAQQVRVNELEQEVELLEKIELDHKNDTISVGSLVEIEFNNLKKLYFISSTSGGTMLRIDGQMILVISALSPIGTSAIGLSSEDNFEVETKNETREYTINRIW